SHEINQTIFSQVKNDLTKLRNTEKKNPSPTREEPEEKSKERPKKPPGKDVYREPTE
ncbi:unnamed protein product, partial [marine sediment metagenome]